MSKHNYSQYSNKKHNKPKVEETVVDETTTTVEAPAEPLEIKMVVEQSETAVVASIEQSETVAEPIVVNETVETVTLPKTVTGTVTGCSKLNVRTKPATDAEVVTVINGDAQVEIDPARSTSDWLKVTTVNGVEGYCMRKFVNAKL